MASTAQYDLNAFTVSNGAIQDLKQLIFLSILEKGSINEIIEIKQGIKNGDKIGGIGDFGLVGSAQPLCNPTYNATKLATVEKEWKLGDLTVAEKLCADDFLNTIAETALKLGTYAGDLTDSELLSYIIEPRLTEALDRAVWRYLWMGDTSAANVANGGNITDGLELKHFNSIDGFFKRLFAAVPTTIGSRYVQIAANTETTKANQLSKILDTNVATGIFDKLILGANMKLRQRKDKVILCTQTMADALAQDIKKNNKGSELQWQSLFDGFMSATIYNGVKIIALPIWDEMIQSFEDKGATFNIPHRAVFCSKSLLWGGMESANSVLPDLDIFFEKKPRETYIYGRENLGTVVWEADLISMAY
ncbi:hypothetical protein E2605_18245 [Dysgonomonas capnocytophagoides]|uniref:Phage major capsid protein n=1 Tax=Dysgonomonas capnocytophagoides TaxID=45254 RepID=A0A4Y8KTZ4_9BACT|nr:hypothetical protein [Dysgonomonas capnocytophagoides]TFD92786.1 hypothetical protein E2605_18245 [Dysgonomonas capnocytophagoides]